MGIVMESRNDLAARNRDLLGEVRRQIESAGIKQVRVVTTDYQGVPRAKMVTADRFLNRTVERGHPWALALLTVDSWQNLPDHSGLGEEIGFGNGVIVPDLRSFHQLPWAPDTAICLTDMFFSGGEPLESPRQILATVLERATARGYTPVFGSECEF
jgi:glutamine synthetase